MAETKRATEHKSEADHGVEVTPHKVITDGGWLHCPENPNPSGENAPWRR